MTTTININRAISDANEEFRYGSVFTIKEKKTSTQKFLSSLFLLRDALIY
ncbi:hypothetical protein HMPREF9148_00773 [Prevotella sp. F0091]|nr:hypothetical protein HMPREF9148_00773 [Prevotella sp. F0091]